MADEELEVKLIFLRSKQENIYSRVERMLEKSKKIVTFESRTNEQFLAETEILDDLRAEYKEIVDGIIMINLALNPKVKPDHGEITVFDDLYSRIKRVRNKLTNTNSALQAPASAPGCSHATKDVIKLPPIELPKFDGKSGNWPLFYEAFKSAVHLNERLSDAQRVQYLISKLTGSALGVTAGIVPTAESYKTLWDSLVKKYQDKRALGCHYLNNVLELEACVHTSVSLNAFIEKFSASVAAMKQLGITDLADFILLHCALKKADPQTVQAFELTVRGKEMPACEEFIKFTQDQVKILERSGSRDVENTGRFRGSTSAQPNTTGRQQNVKSFLSSKNNSELEVAGTNACRMCNSQNHSLLEDCPKFKELGSPDQRFKWINQRRGCSRCLRLSHASIRCRARKVCDICAGLHHTLLHFGKAAMIATKDEGSPQNVKAMMADTKTEIDEGQAVGPQIGLVGFQDGEITQEQIEDQSLSMSVAAPNQSAILLSTAQVLAGANNSQKQLVRCLIDSGSQNNLITAECCKLLNLPITPVSNSYLKGVGLSSRPIHGYVYLDVTSRVDATTNYSIYALVVDLITDTLPAHFIEKCDFAHLEMLTLADPAWNVPGAVDLVIGAQLFPYIWKADRVQPSPSAPAAVLTSFGYVLLGDCPGQGILPVQSFAGAAASFTVFATNDMEACLHKFWELEEVPQKRFLSPDDLQCENMYAASVAKDGSGRYLVSLPFEKDPRELGNSRKSAMRRFHSLERKLDQDSKLRESYNAVIQDYIDNGYLYEVPEESIIEEGYYIPHHAVFRADKPMPRIVLDASAKTQSGLSLNDVLYKGPNLQADLFLLLVNFRLFPVAMTADIKQMYLRIGLMENCHKYVRILFRFRNSEQIRTFQFRSVPFGLKASPFLAMRTVRQLADDSGDRFPEAARVARSQLYMDDLVHSVSDEQSASDLAGDLIKLFKEGSMDLVKWASNSEEVLKDLPESHKTAVNFSGENEESLKILGLAWAPRQDYLFFKTTPIEEKCTKRSILSVVARLFDVLGLVAPVILYAKLLIKELWLAKVDWDETPPENIVQNFIALMEQFPLLSMLAIPRHLGVSTQNKVVIAAFCDASLKGYGCVIYVHTTESDGNILVRLLCSKSKVAPTKITTLARLELCAALLMSKLVRTVLDLVMARVVISGVYAFSDSTIALAWIKSSPHKWSMFVSNRVAQCQERLPSDHFYHVAGSENPSDCLSRGVLPSQLLNHELWWNGPPWLRQPPEEWPLTPLPAVEREEIPEAKSFVTIVGTMAVAEPELYAIVKRSSSWEKILKVVVYVLKFLKRLPSAEVVVNTLFAEKRIVKCVQQVHFAEDIKRLKQNKEPSKKLRSLNAFLDDDGLLRVGGRLTKSLLPFDVKHPMLLPKHDAASNLIIRHYHYLSCHAGAHLLLSIIRQKFWILDARTCIRAEVRKCNACFRVRPIHPTPKMADLPSFRVTEAKAFVHTGVDYAGPIKVTLARRRGQRSQKSYICLFVCLVTKAIHIELVSDLTSDAFLAAFKRFISRRGPVSYLYSDNGTNFIGAKAQLDGLYTLLMSQSFQEQLKRELLNRRIEWKMIPPRAPHFGSMWESNIGSMKTHLYRVIGDQLLTYEELMTVLVQIECVLNSRPLGLLSADPHPELLTPAHFLMSTPLQHLPAENVLDSRVSLVNRKKLLDSLVQSYWRRWHLEYLHTLQIRQKWCTVDRPVQIGTVVLVDQENSPPLHWPLGIITKLYPGSDGTVRVVDVKTRDGSFRRPVVKLYPLPNQ